ncbi:MAG: MarR family transcriptional regulator [Ornithinimicrobium sp.]
MTPPAPRFSAPDLEPDGQPGTSADLAGLAHDLRLVCMRISRRVRFEAAREVASHQFSVLAQLKTESLTLGELADREQVTAPSMSRTVAGLVERELVTRASDPADRRVVLLSLTESGWDLLRRERAQRDAWMAARLEGLSEVDQQILRDATVLLSAVVSR